ncbi:MAG TPA: hypothetical protein VJO35_03000 [Terriglobales bacterium]|nr:hypothetical protein [Terriglobales bacterium]
MSAAQLSRHIGRSVFAVVVGILVGVIITLVTDAVLHKVGFFPPPGVPTPSGPLAVATAYRIVYSILGSYIVARLAPSSPMKHALISGWIGVIVSAAGAVATWNQNLGPHWYPLALVVTALPCAWAGGKLRMMQLPTEPATAVVS